jgi:hypothetical protein
MIRTILLGVVLVVAGITGSAAPPDPPDLVGTYRCNGVNPDGSKYEAVVEITKREGTFRVAWIMDGGTVMGVGIYSNGVFAASYFGGAPAVIVYKVEGDRLVGEWTMGGIEGAIYTETLTKTSSTVQPRAKPAPRPGRPQPDRDTPRERGVQAVDVRPAQAGHYVPKS